MCVGKNIFFKKAPRLHEGLLFDERTMRSDRPLFPREKFFIKFSHHIRDEGEMARTRLPQSRDRLRRMVDDGHGRGDFCIPRTGHIPSHHVCRFLYPRFYIRRVGFPPRAQSFYSPSRVSQFSFLRIPFHRWQQALFSHAKAWNNFLNNKTVITRKT